jgi:hypothetical protein
LHLRKSASIILLLVLLFNMVGYRAWFFYAEKQSDAIMESRLDNSLYDESELVSLTIPLNNPYQLEQTDFVRVTGEVSFDGRIYKFVKRKVSDGKLILLCIPDANKTVLKKAKSDFGHTVNDLAGNSKGPSKTDIQKNFSGNDYICQWAPEQTGQRVKTSRMLHFFSINKPAEVYISSPGKPPQQQA